MVVKTRRFGRPFLWPSRSVLYRHEIPSVQRQSKGQLAGETFLTKKRLQEPSQAKKKGASIPSSTFQSSQPSRHYWFSVWWSCYFFAIVSTFLRCFLRNPLHESYLKQSIEVQMPKFGSMVTDGAPGKVNESDRHKLLTNHRLL